LSFRGENFPRKKHPTAERAALTPTSRPAGVQDGRQGTAEAQRNDPQQHQELRPEWIDSEFFVTAGVAT